MLPDRRQSLRQFLRCFAYDVMFFPRDFTRAPCPRGLPALPRFLAELGLANIVLVVAPNKHAVHFPKGTVRDPSGKRVGPRIPTRLGSPSKSVGLPRSCFLTEVSPCRVELAVACRRCGLFFGSAAFPRQRFRSAVL